MEDDRWRRLPDLPVSVDHAAAASANGRVYVVGGYGGDRLPLRTVFVLERGAWRALARLPDGARRGGGGDRRWQALRRRRHRRAHGRSRAWRSRSRSARRAGRGSPARARGSTSPPPRSGGRVYAIGGRAAGIDTNKTDFEVYDAAAKRWRRLAPLPGARGGTGAAALGGRIVSVGGEEPAGTIRSVYAYDVATRRWSRLPDLPTPRHGLGVVAVNDRIWVVGGGPEPGLTVSGAVESLKP